MWHYSGNIEILFYLCLYYPSILSLFWEYIINLDCFYTFCLMWSKQIFLILCSLFFDLTIFFSSARSSVTTTMVIDGKAGEAGSTTLRSSKKMFTDDLYSTFSSPLAWILVLALIITWTCVFIIMFDVADYKTIAGKRRMVNIWSIITLKLLNIPCYLMLCGSSIIF